MSENILFISRDPGGTNQLVALRYILLGRDGTAKDALFDHLKLSQKTDIKVVAKDYAKTIWQQNEIACEPWPQIKSNEDMISYLADSSPDQIITSTSHVDDRTEQMVWRAAKSLAIKTTAFLDSGDNIALRFTDDNGAVILPDRVSMTNDTAQKSLLALGLAQQDMFISGDLYEDYARSKTQVAGKLHAEWGAKDGECLILFASDYIREMQAMGVRFEVTEFESLNCLIDLLKAGDISKYLVARPPYRLIIRPHPKDSPGKYDDYPQKSCENLTILINDKASSIDAVQSAHVVAGLGSALLHEAGILAVDVLELGPIVRNGKDHQKTVS